MKSIRRTTAPQTIDEFLAGTDAAQRAALQQLRARIRAAVPAAEECISYGIPAFRVDGKFFAGFGAAAGHCAFYPGSTVQRFRRELAGYDTGKGTIRFQPDKPLPAALVRKLLKARLADRAD